MLAKFWQYAIIRTIQTRSRDNGVRSAKAADPRSDSGDKSIKRTKEILLLHKGVRHPLDGGAVRFLFGQEISEATPHNSRLAA